MNIQFQKRIAFNFMIATAIIMAVVFGLIFFIVQESVYGKIDNELQFEARHHIDQLSFRNGQIFFEDESEWEEEEHKEIQINPLFIQIIGADRKVITKSPNLRSNTLKLSNIQFKNGFTTALKGKAIRQVEMPLESEKGKVIGYMVVAKSLQSTLAVLYNLGEVLVFSFLVMLFAFYFTSKYLAKRSVKPIKHMTQIINKITKNNLNERVEVPEAKDELQVLASSFNQLLQRIENTLTRESQFTSDASHELRTPLAALRGTLEVLIRKPRDEKEYIEKVSFCLSELDKLDLKLEHLFILARIDDQTQRKVGESVSLQELINDILAQYKNQVIQKKVTISLDSDLGLEDLVPQYYSNLIVENIITNAIKYTKPNTNVSIKITTTNEQVTLSVTDQGIGIKPSDLENIFQPFFRSEALSHKHILGDGLGLSIVEKAVKVINANVLVESEIGQGTTFRVIF